MKFITITFIAALACVIFVPPISLVTAAPGDSNGMEIESKSELENFPPGFRSFDQLVEEDPETSESEPDKPKPNEAGANQDETDISEEIYEEEESNKYKAKINADNLTYKLNLSREQYKLIYMAAICLTGISSLFIMLSFLSRSNSFTPRDVISSSGLVLIITGTIMIILIADTDQQLTAPIGIMGAIAGYLFGRMSKD